MKSFSFSIIREDQSVMAGEFQVRISSEGKVEVSLLKLESNGPDFMKSAWVAQELLLNRVIRELANDLDAFRYSNRLQIFENTEKEENTIEEIA